MRIYLLFVTTPNRRVSERLMRLAVDRKLAACANRVPGLSSRYWWKGHVETAREELLLMKTTKKRLPSLIKTLRENHPYQVSEALAVPVSRGNPPYLAWLAESVGG